MVDPLELVLILGAATLIGVAVDTYFWVRTTLKLRSFEQELQPRLDTIDAVASTVPGLQLVQSNAVDPSTGAAAAPLKVLRAPKTNRPYVVINGRARFIREDQARAIEAGRPVSFVTGTPAPSLALPSPGPAAAEPPSQNSPSSEFDFNGAAAHLSQLMGQQVSPDAVRAFIAAHSGGGGEPGAVDPGTVAPPASTPDSEESVMKLLLGLTNGTLDKEAAGQIARQALFSKQVESNGGSTEMVGSGGVRW